jgi:hypothetical protein
MAYFPKFHHIFSSLTGVGMIWHTYRRHLKPLGHVQWLIRLSYLNVAGNLNITTKHDVQWVIF